MLNWLLHWTEAQYLLPSQSSRFEILVTWCRTPKRGNSRKVLAQVLAKLGVLSGVLAQVLAGCFCLGFLKGRCLPPAVIAFWPFLEFPVLGSCTRISTQDRREQLIPGTGIFQSGESEAGLEELEQFCVLFPSSFVSKVRGFADVMKLAAWP